MTNIKSLVDTFELINEISSNSSNNSETLNEIILHLIDEYKEQSEDNSNIEIEYLYCNKSTIKKINNKFFKNLGKFEKINKDDNILINNDICSICCDKYKEGNYKRILPNCGHIYHKKCIDKWFKITDNKFCPLCNESYDNIYKKCEKSFSVIL